MWLMNTTSEELQLVSGPFMILVKKYNERNFLINGTQLFYEIKRFSTSVSKSTFWEVFVF